MANPIVFNAGTTTLNSSHALKMTKLTAVATSLTAVSVVLTDLGGNVIGVPVYIQTPATVNAEVTADFATPCIVPGGVNLSLTNAIITVTGAGGVAYLYHR